MSAGIKFKMGAPATPLSMKAGEVDRELLLALRVNSVRQNLLVFVAPSGRRNSC
jgi:hypothetical protein